MYVYVLLVCAIFAEVLTLPVISNGVGDILVVGDDVLASGATVVEGAVPITGSVGFNGPVWAKGSVTIIGRCSPPRQHLPAYIPMISVDSIPVAMLIAEEVDNVGSGSFSTVGEMPVKGVTEMVGVVPIIGDVCFGGLVRAKGTVTVSGSCCY